MITRSICPALAACSLGPIVDRNGLELLMECELLDERLHAAQRSSSDDQDFAGIRHVSAPGAVSSRQGMARNRSLGVKRAAGLPLDDSSQLGSAGCSMRRRALFDPRPDQSRAAAPGHPARRTARNACRPRSAAASAPTTFEGGGRWRDADAAGDVLGSVACGGGPIATRIRPRRCPTRRIHPTLAWCEDTTDRRYNRRSKRSAGDGGDRLWRDDQL